MKAIVGIGNPGKKYLNTKHNTGFSFIDFLIEPNKLLLTNSKEDYFVAKGDLNGVPFLLVKPMTYVNLSGIAVKLISEEYQIEPKDILIIIDDINLPFGEIRIRKGGGDGGHNGLSSIIYYLETNQFPRLRIGISKDFENGQMADYVLSKFSSDELIKLGKIFEYCKNLTNQFILKEYKGMLDFYSKNPLNLILTNKE